MVKRINISGMSCDHCVKHVAKALEELPDVKDVNVSLKSNSATADVGSVGDDTIKNAISEAGYTVTAITDL